MFGDPITTPGGWAPKFYASLRLEVRRIRVEKKDGRQKIRIAVKKSKLSPPFRECDLWLFWDGRFEEAGRDLLVLAKEKGLVEVSERAGWITWLPTGEKRQGAEALGKYLEESGEISKVTGG